MFMVYLLWIVIVFGGGFMGVQAVVAIREGGLTIALFLNALLYFGCALYAVPKLWQLLFSRGDTP